MQSPNDITETATADQYFDLKGLASYSSLGVSTLRFLISEKSLPVFRVTGKSGNTGKILIKRSEFDVWMERYRSDKQLKVDVVVNEVLNSLQ
ncbi:MAG: MerR family transcriptional regulator [Planctomycetota bacterium]|jgi:hypothetical protein